MAFAFIFLLFFVLLVKPGRLAYSNYLGECSDTKTRVTDKEKIDAAIEKIFSYYPKNNQELHRWFAMPYLSAREGATPERYPIPYKDLEEFKAINPDCCRVVRQPSDVEDAPAALFDQLAGTKGSFVEVHFSFDIENVAMK